MSSMKLECKNCGNKKSFYRTVHIKALEVIEVNDLDISNTITVFKKNDVTYESDTVYCNDCDDQLANQLDEKSDKIVIL